MSLATLFKKLGAEHGIQIDDSELEEIGLSDDDGGDVCSRPSVDEFTIDLDSVLAGEAAGAIELFLSEPLSMLADGKAREADGLMWEPIIREGQWAVRPGARGQKLRRPLKVIAGHSKNQRKEIGLADILDAHNDRAVEHVTVPTSHDNLVTQNTGFIKALKIVQGKVKDAKTKTEKTVAILMGGYDIRKKDIKESMDDGTIASRSAGLLYDYVNTETGKTYPVVLEHVALTNKPWITGMKAFGRKLVKPIKQATVGLSLSDDEPTDEELLSADDALDGIELATTEITWDQEDDPDWLREQTNNVLRASRAAKQAKVAGKGGYIEYDLYPRYRCVKARPGLALVADGWGDEANFWTVPISVVDGLVEVDENLENWKASKRVFVPDDDRKEFPEGREPLAAEQADSDKNLSELQLAQKARRARAASTTEGGPSPDENTTHPRGGEHMAGENGTLQLSEEAQRVIDAANKRAEAAEKLANELKGQVTTLMSRSVTSDADAFVSHLKGIGLDEEHGFAGALVVVRDLMSEDDGGPAVQSDKFSDDTNADGQLTLSDAIRRVFKAIELGDDGKVKLGQKITEPVTTTTEVKDGEEVKTEVKLGDDGKPLPDVPEDKAFEEMSEDEQLSELVEGSGDIFDMLRIPKPGASGNGNGGEK